ncbi:MAG: hypothetical protein ACXAC2_07495 [Candidatus Kariarchaeaceae archaeon]|jgi:hypothetical protein
MSEVKDKFCEECGKTSSIEVKFCKFCGTEFPVIDHPDYVRAHMPPQPPQQPQYIAEQQPMNSQTGLPPIQFQPSKQNYQQGDYPISRPPPGHFSHKPPRMWGGGGLFHASKQLYLNPV